MAAPSSPSPAPHPEPPPGLAGRTLPIDVIQVPWFRIHRSEVHPLHFGRTRLYRFDDPRDEFGVLYVASDPHCAFVETFGQATGISTVTTAALAERSLVAIETEGPLALVDLRGEGLARIGADARLCTGEYPLAQRWSRALWEHSASPQGILYRSRHDPSRLCAAVFDRARALVRSEPRGSLLDADNLPLLGDILDTYGFGLIEV